jgi:hypothetical protein
MGIIGLLWRIYKQIGKELMAPKIQMGREKVYMWANGMGHYGK